MIDWAISENNLTVRDLDYFHLNLIKILQQCPEITSKGRFIKLNNLYYIYRNYRHDKVNKYLQDSTECYEIINDYCSIIAKYRNGWLTGKTRASQDYRQAILFIERIYNFIFIEQLDLNNDIIFYIKEFYLSVNNEIKIL